MFFLKNESEVAHTSSRYLKLNKIDLTSLISDVTETKIINLILSKTSNNACKINRNFT